MRISKTRSLITLLGVLLCSGFAWNSPSAAAQDAQQQVKIPPRSNYQYRKDYAACQELLKEPDLQKRADALMNFIKEHPESRMIPSISVYIANIGAEYAKAGNWQKVINLDLTYLKLVPDDTVNLPLLMSAYYQTKNLPKAAEIGEKIYAADSSVKNAEVLAQLYLAMNNTDKYTVYAEKIVAATPVEKSYSTMLKLAEINMQKQNTAKAMGYLTKVVEAFGDKVPPGMQESAWKATRGVVYGAQAGEAYKQKDYPKAIELYQKVAQVNPQAEEAYYYIGMAKWQSKDQLGAIDSFAKTVVLNKAHAAKAKEYMEQLYKAEHSDKLDGIDEVLAKAKTALGIS